MNEFLWTMLAGVPLVIWVIFGFVYTFGVAFTQLLFGAWFHKYIWNREQMVELLGEDVVRKLG